MAWPQCNSTLENEGINETPIWNGYKFHYLGLWLSAVFGLIAIVVSFFLIYMHATHYLKPYEQRHIIRILFMVPVYAAVSFLSFIFYQHSVYFEVIRDCYEAFAIASFFSLMCSYIAPDLHGQKNYFRMITPRDWIWPMKWIQRCCGGEHGIWRTPRSGLTWFNVIWVCVFQYCFIRVFMTCVAVTTQAFERYCLESLNPAFAHVWVMVIEAAAVTVAMYCLIQFYVQVRGDIQQHKPLLKVLAIKLVIFLSFWQTLLISFLTSTGVIKANNQIQTPDIKVGIPAMLLCIEMAIFSIFHLWAFSYRPYALKSKQNRANVLAGESEPTSYKGGFLGARALFDSFNVWDLVKAVGRAAKWLFHGRKHRHHDVSYDLSRKNTQNTDFTPGSSEFHAPTAYAGVSPPKVPRYGRAEPSEGEKLLENSQGVGMSRLAVPRSGVSPYRGDGGSEYELPHGDIGIATSTYDERNNYGPFVQQESGITPAPYPDPQLDNRVRGGRVSMPHFPPPPDPHGRDNMF